MPKHNFHHTGSYTEAKANNVQSSIDTRNYPSQNETQNSADMCFFKHTDTFVGLLNSVSHLHIKKKEKKIQWEMILAYIHSEDWAI